MKLRAHHGMCLAFFAGKGYDDIFTANMAKVQADMKKNPMVTIIKEADVICQKCPCLQKGICTAQTQTECYDCKVLAYCDIEENTTMTWQAFSALVAKHIFQQGKRQEICGSCSWSYICDKKEADMQMD